jgi:hypothetical protein
MPKRRVGGEGRKWVGRRKRELWSANRHRPGIHPEKGAVCVTKGKVGDIRKNPAAGRASGKPLEWRGES